MRHIHVNCYWDAQHKDHIVEMSRVKGDGLFPSTFEFYETIRRHVLGADKYVAPASLAERKPMMPGPPLLRREGKLAAFAVTEDMFLKGIKSIFNLADDHFFEPRLEAVKAICDMAKRDRRLLEIPFCRDNVVRCLNNLLNDDFEDIRQFAVFATAQFALNVPSYRVSKLALFSFST
jgi:hypothetical protein